MFLNAPSYPPAVILGSPKFTRCAGSAQEHLHVLFLGLASVFFRQVFDQILKVILDCQGAQIGPNMNKTGEEL